MPEVCFKDIEEQIIKCTVNAKKLEQPKQSEIKK